MTKTRKTDRSYGEIQELIRIRGRKMKEFSRLDFPELTRVQSMNVFLSLHSSGEIVLVKKAIRGRFGSPPIYKFKK